MKEINELFKTQEIKKIKELLEKVIGEIEKSDKEKRNLLLDEVVAKAKETEKELKEEYRIINDVYFFPENIAPLALLCEEISIDADNGENMLQILKFNLNNYFSKFKPSKPNDWYVDVKDLKHVFTALELECNFFTMLKKHGIKLSIMLFGVRYRKSGMEIINYCNVTNKNFVIHGFHCEPHKNGETVSEICLKQFGNLLKEIVVGDSQRAPDGFLELFEKIDMPEIDEESKELQILFADAFMHYIIEKMEMRITNEKGPDWKENSGPRDEEFAQKLVQYFDNMFNELLKEDVEWEDNDKCPCGSGKKYKNCCKKRKMKFYKTDDENTCIRGIPMHPEIEPMLHKEHIRFKKIFGRMPGKDDYIQGGVLLRDLKRGYKLIKRNNIVDKAWLYASDKTGLMLTEENQHLIPERDVKEFAKYVYEYNKLMKSSIKGNTWNLLQASEAVNFMLDFALGNEIGDMIYVLNLYVNFYGTNKDGEEKFIIKNIKDFLVFCSYKASLHLTVLQEMVEQEYYDTAMTEVRILFEILITMRAYKRDPKLFEDKILSVMGVELGTHRKIEGKSIVEEIATGKQYKYEIQKKQLAERAGENYEKLYDNFYRELSEFIHLDTESAKGIFQDKDLFLDIDECLMARCIGMIFGLEIIMELIDFEGSDKKMNKDIKYFSNKLLKLFLDTWPTIMSIENKEIYKVIEDTLKEYKTDYKINYQRNRKYEVF